MALSLRPVEAYGESKVAEKEWAAAINLAGRQRMLSQKMAKEFLLVALKVDDAENRKSCRATATMFSESLERLLRGDSELGIPAPPSKEIEQQLQKIKGLWDTFGAQLSAGLGETAISPEALSAVATLNAPLLLEMNKAVSMYDSESQKAGVKGLGTVVNIAGRQRMLTQKLSKQILLVKLGIDVDANRKAIVEGKTLFQTSHLGLVGGNAELGLPGTSTPLTVAQMKKVQGLWSEFLPLVDQAISNSDLSQEAIQKVAQLNVKILAEMNRAVSMFEAEAK